jgi:uncharacterized protein (DUF433 family)
MRVAIPINYIERKSDSDYYRIIGKGVTVEFLSRLIDDPEWPIERICDNYGLTPAEVHAAWSFYYDHQAEIDHRIEKAAQLHEAAAPDNAELRATLTERYLAKAGKPYPDEG